MHEDLSNGLALFISSPGGSGLAAERIVNVCRTYSGNRFEVVVPKQAKSAATMICLGAKKVHMSPTSELGPIDPQFFQVLADGSRGLLPADIIVQTYKSLLSDAVNTPGRVEPYLQQLDRYDARFVGIMERETQLGEEMAVTLLKTGMMSSTSKSKIKAKIKLFTDPTMAGSHGRPIFREQAANCGLVIQNIDHTADPWKWIMELHVRSDLMVTGQNAKLIESKKNTFVAQAPRRREEI